MSTLAIHDLERTRELDHKAMSAVHGGHALPTDLGTFANVNVNVNQNITQLQDIEVNALNNVGVIGAGFGPFKLDVNPMQIAKANAVI
ncbi:MAG TPA: hypothetical protein VJ698_19025 [Noviherbaspirillum sp.]|uniref:hypothetical protein n=1 Tax=Noviherbaspirillum sp. TaxID=1926288 RepID=UPI002B4949E3|nr:hypothetical protein [Noviherbaspirillum sp.]HJV87570.1 hypothetical protein [Noviherbaspirillum sp.]